MVFVGPGQRAAVDLSVVPRHIQVVQTSNQSSRGPHRAHKPSKRESRPNRAAPSIPGKIGNILLPRCIKTLPYLANDRVLSLEYAPVNKNQKFMRQKSVEQQHNKAPSLRKEGAQKMSKKIAHAHARGDPDFMKTPDPGVSG